MAMAQPLLTSSSTMRVLIAEDTDSVRFALRLAMEYLGHEVVGVASDGQEALEKYHCTQPEIVLMDVRMPRMDGLTCTSLLAKQDPNAKVVIVTAGRTSEHEAREAGARGFVEKPFEIDQLDRLIHSLAAA
jgi:DNA-binding NarL/FixJ family response regulator